jgi:hypothetical protein
MNQSQIQGVETQWRDRVSGPNNHDFLEVSCFFRPDGEDCARLTERKGPVVNGRAPTSHSALITHRTAFFCSFTYSGFHSAVSKCPGAR